MDAKVRGDCPVCGRSVALTRDGAIGRHGSKIKHLWPPQMCPGWSQLPKDVTS